MTEHNQPENTLPAALHEDKDEDLYRIGTVAQLTNISVERLRAWERRHGMAPAFRAGKTRFYSKPQVQRLIKLKRLIDNGHPISSIADLTDEQLDDRLATQRLMSAKPARTGLIGPNLLVLEQQQSEPQRIEVCARWANLQAFSREQQAAESASAALDAIVVQLPVLNLQHIDSIEELCPGTHLVALYQFATAKQISEVEARGIPTMKWPASWTEIEYAAASGGGSSAASSKAVERRFADEELIAIAASALGDASGCPQHLVELISQLNAFAEYAADYQTQTVSGDPQQCAQTSLYQRIHTDATHARAQLEQALEALAIAEGLIASPN